MSTTAIDTLQSILNFKVTDGSMKLPVYVNEWINSKNNGIYLFYNGDTTYTRNTLAAYYNQAIQIAVKHSDYDKARSSAFTAIEYLNSRRKSGDNYYRPETAPTYAGIDDNSGCHVWTFDIISQGGK